MQEPQESAAVLAAAVRLFDQGSYLASHELFEELWEGTEGPESGFYKGLLQAAVALHHFREGNLEGAARLFADHRRTLAPYLPHHRGLDLARFLGEMQRVLRPVVRRRPGEVPCFRAQDRPRLLPGGTCGGASEDEEASEGASPGR